MIDAHCHWQHVLARDEAGDPVGETCLLERAATAGITHIVTCACSVLDWTRIYVNHSRVKLLPQLGIHPWWAHEIEANDFEWLTRLRTLLVANPTYGVGEIGLDKNRAKKISMSHQSEIFCAQLRLAKELNRTCSVHCVNAFGPLLVFLKDATTRSNLVMHSYSGSIETVRELMKLNDWDVYFSVSAQCPNALVIPHIPLDRLLIETDAPDQANTCSNLVSLSQVAPLGFNDCSQLALVANRVAIATSMSVEEIKAVTSQNAIRAFQIQIYRLSRFSN